MISLWGDRRGLQPGKWCEVSIPFDEQKLVKLGNLLGRNVSQQRGCRTRAGTGAACNRSTLNDAGGW
jgi:hypothetical protein